MINDVYQSYSSGYIITGVVYDIYSSPFISKTDDTGGVVIPVVDDYSHGSGLSLCKTSDSNYIASSFSDEENIISKVNDNCIAYWSEDVTDISYLSFASIAATNDNGALAFGGNNISGSDMVVVAYDNVGNLLWEKEMGGSLADMANSGFQSVNGNYVTAGYTNSNDGDVSGNHGGTDGLIVEFGTNVGVPGITQTPTEIQAYPVPAKDKIYIDLPKGYENATLKLVDVSGKGVPVKEDNNNLSRVLYLNGLPAGEYLLQVTDNGVYNSKKIIHY